MVYSMFLARKKIIQDVVICYGDVIFDENDTQWKIKTPDGFITVSVEELIAANKRGDIAEMKKTVTEGDSGSDQRSGRG